MIVCVLLLYRAQCACERVCWWRIELSVDDVYIALQIINTNRHIPTECYLYIRKKRRSKRALPVDLKGNLQLNACVRSSRVWVYGKGDVTIQRCRFAVWAKSTFDRQNIGRSPLYLCDKEPKRKKKTQRTNQQNQEKQIMLLLMIIMFFFLKISHIELTQWYFICFTMEWQLKNFQCTIRTRWNAHFCLNHMNFSLLTLWLFYVHQINCFMKCVKRKMGQHFHSFWLRLIWTLFAHSQWAHF